jgi:hypothetical protein
MPLCSMQPERPKVVPPFAQPGAIVHKTLSRLGARDLAVHILPKVRRRCPAAVCWSCFLITTADSCAGGTVKRLPHPGWLAQGTNVHGEEAASAMQAMQPAAVVVLDQGSRPGPPIVPGAPAEPAALLPCSRKQACHMIHMHATPSSTSKSASCALSIAHLCPKDLPDAQACTQRRPAQAACPLSFWTTTPPPGSLRARRC